MVPTVEVRWFLPFQSTGGRSNPPDLMAGSEVLTRTDWYAPSRVECGIKLREGNLEAKFLLRTIGVCDLGGRSGRVEQWRKWIFSAAGGVTIDDHFLSSAGWFPVTKHRSLIVFERRGNGGMHQVAEWPQSGCQFEWTELTAGSRRWLSIGLEAFGQPMDLEESLRVTAGKVMPSIPPGLTLDETTSMSYPEWLASARV